ncbi:MAG: hypothetical protein ACK5N8_04405 [Alphaproteobacteria bacterium]
MKLVQDTFSLETKTDAEGFFIFDDIKFGRYVLEIYDLENNPLFEKKILINESLVTIDEVISLKIFGLETQAQ